MADALPISGEIDPKAFPFLLVDLHRQGATGSLKVETASHQKALYFRSGRVLFGSSNDPKDQLGAILIESGKLTHAQFDDVNKKVGPGNPLAKALSDSGLVSQRELSEAARAKVERILADVISYTEGSFEFEDGVLPKGAVDLKLSTERLFLSAVRRIGDRAFVLRHLEGIGVVLRAKTEIPGPFAEIESETAGLPQMLDGRTTLKDAAGSLGMDEFDAAKVASALLFLGLVEPGTGAGAEGSEEVSPFFVPTEEDAGAELDLGANESGAFAPGPEAQPHGEHAMEATIMLSSPPSFAASESFGASEPSFGGSPPAFGAEVAPEAEPEVISESEVSPPAVEAFALASPAATATNSGQPPLRIIAPPKPADRTRPPTKTSKEELAAVDELLHKNAVEGPLAPLQKPSEEEWRPQFLQASGRSRGKRSSRVSGKVLVLGGGALALVLGGLLAYLYLTQDSAPRAGQAQAARSPAPDQPAPSHAPSVAAASPTPTPPAASASTTLPATATSPVASPAASPVAAKPAPPSATPAPPTPVAAPRASASPSLAAPAQASSGPKQLPPVTTPAKTSAPTSAASGGLPAARALMRKGKLDAAAREFASSLKSGPSNVTLQLLLACSSETVQKALDAVPSDELFIIPVHYKGRDCFRVCWGVYESEARAASASRGVHDYFQKERVTPKPVSLASILK